MTSTEAWRPLPDDWFAGGIPPNAHLGARAYVDSSYAFANFLSRQPDGFVLGEASGVYDRAALVVGPSGRVHVGAFAVLNGCYVLCHEHVAIGAHALIAWGVVITDSWCGALPLSQRRALLRAAARHPDRYLSPADGVRPVAIGDNTWIGFDSVVLPGVTIGRGAIVGARSVIREDVAPYTVVVGDPPRVIASLDPDDTADARRAALIHLSRG